MNSQNPSNKLRTQRKDLSPYLFHFTKGDNPFVNMNSILSKCYLRSEHWNYICFTDAPITSNIALLDYMEKKHHIPLYSKFGIGFSRDIMFENYGARNVIYDKVESIPHDAKGIPNWRYERMSSGSHDFSWLREWRIQGKSFDFSTFPKEDIIVVAPTKEQLLELVGYEEFEEDFSFEPETGECIQYIHQTNKRLWKGFAIDEIKQMHDDFCVSGSTKNQVLGEDIGFV